MKTSRQARHISFAVAAFAASACMAAHAEYRCNGNALPAEQRACELAKQGPDALRMFVDRTRGIYGLYFYDYVTEADVSRWHAEGRNEPAQPIRAVDNRDKGQSVN
jgi:hypothetical protein